MGKALRWRNIHEKILYERYVLRQPLSRVARVYRLSRAETRRLEAEALKTWRQVWERN